MIEYLLANMWQVWAVVSVLCLILELSSGDFFIMCFAIGGVGAAIVSPFAGIYVQLGVFIVVTAFSLSQVRPFALRYLHRNEKPRASNVDVLIGMQGRVTEDIPSRGFGRVYANGDDWKAAAITDEPLKAGTVVRIVSRESVVVTVEKIS